MSRLPVNHDTLYFDSLFRAQKGESVLSLIYATYQAKKECTNNNAREVIAQRFLYALNLFKHDAGTYTGTVDQFESRYTIGHELCIWKNRYLDLTPLALKVAENQITIRDYFDIIFLNYFQPINGNIVHILYHVLKYMSDNHLDRISKSQIDEAYKAVGHYTREGNINGAFNMLTVTHYFVADRDNLVYNGDCSIEQLMSRCDTTYVEKGYDAARQELDSEENYVSYISNDHRSTNDNGETQSSSNGLIDFSDFISGGYNAIYYGTPGCGKSYYVEHELLKNVDERYKFRTTFYQEYTHTDFVGQLIPVIDKKTGNDGSEVDSVTYKFVPGPFTLALETAYMNPKSMVYLIIEEINRGHAASILGDIFQLLDREKEGNVKGMPVGQSEYFIDKVDVSNYLAVEKHINLPNNRIFIPSNMCLIGTMNTNDQNVSALDTAFKRRWKMRKITNDFKADHPYASKYVPGTEVTWRIFVEQINNRIVSDSSTGINAEDKQIGPYFMASYDLDIEPLKKDDEHIREFAYKVFEYLWSNVAKYERGNWFKNNPKTLDNLVDNYIEKGLDVFEGDIFADDSQEDVQLLPGDREEE